MKQKMWVWFLVCFFGFGLKLAWAEWYPGVIHTHSTFSDGTRSPKLLVNRAKGVGEFTKGPEVPRFLIVTDHYEQIKSFDRYRDDFAKLASSDFVIITGAEVTTYWNGAASHLLALGTITSDNDLMKWQGQKGTQQSVINRVNELGLLSVAAHPSLTALRYRQWVGEFDNLQFDPTVRTGLKGIEFFNDEPEGYIRTRDLWYLTRVRRGDNIFVTSGCDSHWPTDVYDDARWTRKTWVYCKELNQKSLLEAIAQGHTYAAQYGARFENLNHIPGFQTKEVDSAKFVFGVVFDKKINNPKTIRIYRDGILVPESVKTLPEYPKGMTNIEKKLFMFDRIDYAWEDKKAGPGEHSYVIEVEGVLITSPIKLKIGGTNQEKAEPNKLTGFVKDQHGKPVENAAVWLADCYMAEYGHSETNQLGYFEIPLSYIGQKRPPVPVPGVLPVEPSKKSSPTEIFLEGTYTLYIIKGEDTSHFYALKRIDLYEPYKKVINITERKAKEGIFLGVITFRKWYRITAKVVDKSGSPYQVYWGVYKPDCSTPEYQEWSDEIQTCPLPEGVYRLKLWAHPIGWELPEKPIGWESTEKEVIISGNDVDLGEIVIPDNK